MQNMQRFSIMLAFLHFFLFCLIPTVQAKLVVWANNGEDKVTQDDLRANNNITSVINAVWDGSRICLSGAKNEVVAFNLILESAATGATGVDVSFNTLTGPGNAAISSKTATKTTLFDWTDRHIELFYIRYLKIKGLSRLSYNATYDERHIPERFRRPWTGEGDGVGSWADRPDHNKFYPDIAVPLELERPFDITADTNQSVWVDIYIPKTSTTGTYTGTMAVSYNEGETQSIPIELTVYNFALPDYPSAPSMLYYSNYNINYRYLGRQYIYSDSVLYQQSLDLIDTHFKMAHRHKVSLIGEETLTSDMNQHSIDWLSGDLFTDANGYDGPGVSTGNNVFSIGTYSAWTDSWSDSSKEEMWTNTDTWVNWFDTQNFSTPTEYFIYLIDESDDYEFQEKWAKWIDENPGPGNRLLSFATISSPSVWESNLPSLDIPCNGIAMGITDLWENATQKLVNDSTKRFYYYNGVRPASGSYCIEDDGVALRVNGWIQYKKQIDRWFFWESTYYNNYQGGTGETDVFNQAFTYGINDEVHERYGEYGWNYMNGDGVLFYPGTDLLYPNSNYGVAGPFASLRLKYWRRGIQDADYLAQASAVDKTATDQIVEQMIPKVLWDHGVNNPEDPTYVYADISWSTDPDDWEKARENLADIITQDGITYTQVAKLYVATFNRAPRQAGLIYWVNSGLTIEQIAESFFDQAEIQTKYPKGTSETDFVTTIYQNLFCRAPAQAGLDYWVGALTIGILSRENMIVAVANGALGVDAEILANKTEVGLYYGESGLTGTDFSLSDITADAATVTAAKLRIDGMDGL